MSAARARVHAMFNLDEDTERELDTRLDACIAEALNEAADEIATAQQRLVVKSTVVNILRRRASQAGEKASATAPTATPGPTGRVKQLLDAIRTARGTWTTSRAFQFYRDNFRATDGLPLGQIRTVARGDLRDLAAWGHLTVSDTSGRREYRLATRKDVRP